MSGLLTLLRHHPTSGGPVPGGYAVAFTTDPISDVNASAAAFQISGAEVGATFNYSITSSGGGTTASGSGTISTATQSVTGINVSGLNDGILTVSLTLTNAKGTGSAATDNVLKQWLPTDISGCQIWLDASDTGTITHAANAVSQWNDKSGNARHATQGTATNQPATNTRSVNGRNVIEYDGSNDFLTLPSGLFGLSAGANTVLVVAAMDTTSTVDRLWQGAVSSSTRASFRLTVGGHGVQNRTSVILTISSVTRDTGVHLHGYRRSGPDIRGFIDGMLGLAGTDAQDVTVDSLRLGDTTDAVDGVFCEVIAYNSSLTNAQLNRAGAALAAKWGFTWTPV